MRERIKADCLSLSKYSNEYGVSVSTLRRKIKANKINFELIHGKYYLPRPDIQQPQLSAFTPVPNRKAYSQTGPPQNDFPDPDMAFLLDNIRKVYKNLQSKEEQIVQLKQQVANLKTLVMCLERKDERGLQKRTFPAFL